MDRRIKRTKTAVFNAMLELMVEKETNKITVLELCKRADINKSTFYLHYKSMDDCILQCFEVIANAFIEISKFVKYDEIKRNPKPFVDKVLDEVIKNQDYLCKFKASSNCGTSIKVIKESLVKNICEQNGFTREKNYYEVTNITFAVAGFFDIAVEMMPNLDKETASRSICTMLKSRNS